MNAEIDRRIDEIVKCGFANASSLKEANSVDSAMTEVDPPSEDSVEHATLDENANVFVHL